MSELMRPGFHRRKEADENRSARLQALGAGVGKFEELGCCIMRNSDRQRSNPPILGCIERIEELLERETSALKNCAPLDFEDFNLRKSHALLELSRVYRSPSAQISESILQRLRDLQSKLTENRLLLEQHLTAMREIASIMMRNAEMAESDGTYSKRVLQGRRLGRHP